MLRSKDDIELEIDEKLASNQTISNDHETLKENVPYSDMVQDQTSTDFEMLKKTSSTTEYESSNQSIDELQRYLIVFFKSWLG